MNWDLPILTDSGGFQVFSLWQQKNDWRRSKIQISYRRKLSYVFSRKNLWVKDRSRRIFLWLLTNVPRILVIQSGKIINENLRTVGWKDALNGRKIILNCTDTNKDFSNCSGIYLFRFKKNFSKVISEASRRKCNRRFLLREPEEEMYRITDEVTDILPKAKIPDGS
jgi:queuine tRNA-ribosyltransferase